MTLHEFLSKLSYAKEVPGGWQARCPSHEDKNPSLSVKEASSDRRILLHCFAGCSVEAICTAVGIEPSDLFPDREKPEKKEIVATYDYKSLDGETRYQVVRFSPKDFRQRRPMAGGTWEWSVKGSEMCVYRWPELQGQKTVAIVEGEKDADAAWKAGMAATCNAGGAGKWRQEYASQLKQVGVQRVVVFPDNDPPGEEHAAAVAASCHKAGIAVRLVRLPSLPPKGDLSDYLAAHSLEDLKRVSLNTPAWTPNGHVPDRLFEALGHRRYRMTARAAHIRLEVHHLRRESHKAWGELRVGLDEFFPAAKHLRDGLIHVGDLDLSSVNARESRAKILEKRSGDKDVDWYGLLEEFAVETLAAADAGTPPVRLIELPEPAEESAAIWDVDGLPVLPELPMVLYGDSASAKSILALWVAGTLAARGVAVLYADWEFAGSEQRKRFRRLFARMSADLHYVRCDRPLAKDADRLSGFVADLGCKYVVCDSMGFAADGPTETQEVATRYFEAVRGFGIGSLHVAHITKNVEEGKRPTIFGSAFYRAGARSSWYVCAAQQPDRDVMSIGLFHDKSNTTAKHSPRAYTLTFTTDRIAVERIDIYTVPDLAALLPLPERLLRLLRDDGERTVKRAAEELNVTQKAIYAVVAKHRKDFWKSGDTIAVAEQARQADTPPPPSSPEKDGSIDF